MKGKFLSQEDDTDQNVRHPRPSVEESGSVVGLPPLSELLDQCRNDYGMRIISTVDSVEAIERIVKRKVDEIIQIPGEPIQDLLDLEHRELYLPAATLVYLIALQEAFIKDYLFSLLWNRRELLRTQETITYEQLATFESLDEAVASIAKRKVDQLTGIFEVADYLEKRFDLSLDNDFKLWPKLVEANCRRNIIVHNDGETNETYCRRTGYKRRGQLLDTDIKYIQEIKEVLIEFVEFIHSELSSRFTTSACNANKEEDSP
jgi:hypothetical protein